MDMIDSPIRLAKHTQTIHGTGIVPYIYHKKSTIHVGKHTSPMDGMGHPEVQWVGRPFCG